MVIIEKDGLPIRLKKEFDFSFLPSCSRVFKVFDDQDSGNLCFGVERDGARFFLKLAGPSTVRFSGDTREAVERLKRTVRVYDDLAHDSLIGIVHHEAVSGGYYTLSPWTDALCMGAQYGFRDRILGLPLEEKLGIFQRILDFHIHVHDRGYVAIDFYDGSIMYDFDKRETLLCDIEFYRKKPVRNIWGRMWGSSRFMAPEEFEMGAAIDERTNLFLMGATAFVLFGGAKDRSPDLWTAGAERYEAAVKAAKPCRKERYLTLREFKARWNSASATL